MVEPRTTDSNSFVFR